MKKEIYLAELVQQIRKLPEAERRDVLADYEAHFEAGREAGKTDAEIARSLGSPRSVGQEILMNTLVKQIDSAPGRPRFPSAIGHILLMILVLAPFNFFMLVCPFLLLFALVLTGWTFPLVLGGVAFAALGFFLKFNGDPVGLWSGLSLICMFLGVLGLAATAAMIMALITRAAFQILFSFFKWNIDFIQSRRPASAVTGA